MDYESKYEKAKEFCKLYENAQAFTECKEKFLELFELAKDKFSSEELEEFSNYQKLLRDDQVDYRRLRILENN